ncbi:hypothetical protein [Sphingobacterium sp. UGAL515B_05]|uniref:hypothetical protein n=1 Tax=Sphingobacterium sp. UGAL515B_05 TaxID=2986767 RepID=UPI002954B40A|nr:hypothetical protein [Sphingobacterium sp. UGAL515B_05]WON95045.1 hypothetical protein OK025_01205 [Sphingobacterium sp. UGAL515B_05]
MMESIQQVKYGNDMEMYVHYPDFIWVCIASFLFGGICWYIGTVASLSNWFDGRPLIVSYLFNVLIASLALFYIRSVIKLLDKKKSWLLHLGDRLGTQFFFCVLLPTVLIFGVLRPVAAPKSEWIWLPLLVIFVCILLFNMIYTTFFYWSVYRKRERYLIRLERALQQHNNIIGREGGQVDLQSFDSSDYMEPSLADETGKETDSVEEIDLTLLKSINPALKEFVINNRYLTKKIMYNELGIFLFEKTNNTPIVKLYLKEDMADSKGCEQRSLNEIVRDTHGFVQKIDRHHAIPLAMIKACYQLKGGRLRILLHRPFGAIESFKVAPTIARRIKDWVMLQVPIEKENTNNNNLE